MGLQLKNLELPWRTSELDYLLDSGLTCTDICECIQRYIYPRLHGQLFLYRTTKKFFHICEEKKNNSNLSN
jgi:hypothetical protein